MKRYLPFVLTLVFVFVFGFVLTLEVSAFNPSPDPNPVLCCTYTTWCGTVGYGSFVVELYYDQQGKLKERTVCKFLLPNDPNYNPACNYIPAGGCNIE